MITYYHPLDIVPGGVSPVIHVSQGDTNTRIAFELTARTGSYLIQGGSVATVEGKRSDGTAVVAVANINGNRIYITLTEEMTKTAGRGRYEVVLTKSGKTLGTANFILMVEKKA